MSKVSASKSTIPLFTPQIAQCNTHPQVTLINSLLPLEKKPHTLVVTSDLHFKFNAHDKFKVTLASPHINNSTSSMPLLVPTGVNKRKPYSSPICSFSDPFSCMQLPFGSSYLIQKLKNIQNSALQIATGCTARLGIRNKTRMLPVHDHLSLISSQYLARALQPNNPSHSIFTSARASETR